jgi:hypothetical protein
MKCDRGAWMALSRPEESRDYPQMILPQSDPPFRDKQTPKH